MFIEAHKSLLVRFLLALILVMGILGVKPVQPVLAGTITVTNTNDSGGGSLRQAIASAVSGDTITFGSSLSGQTITLASTLVIDKNLTIDGSSLASKIGISGNNSVRVFQVSSGITTILNSLIIKNGSRLDQEGGGGLNFGTLTISHSTFSGNVARHGGGIINVGSLTITDSTFTDNHAVGSTPNSSSDGGGILNLGTLNIISSTFSNNTTNSYGSGGAIFNGNGSTLNISNSTFLGNNAMSGGGINNNVDSNTNITGSTFTGNSAQIGGAIWNTNDSMVTISNSSFSFNVGMGRGGAVDNSGILSVTDSTFLSNTAGNIHTSTDGGGIYNIGTATIKNSTFANNSATAGGGAIANGNSLVLINSTFSGNVANISGGGIKNGGTIDITNSTFSGNQAGSLPGGSGIFNGGIMKYVNTIIANSTFFDDCYNIGTVEVNTNNLVEKNAVSPNNCGTSALSADPSLGILVNNGGFTETMALLPGSVAINAGDDAKCPATDQRGVTRPQGSHCDIGAYEFGRTFTDVPNTYWSWSYIERLYVAGITGGCSSNPLMYCPGSIVTRDQMAVFLLKGKHGPSYVPPAPSGVFADVPTNYWAAAWIEQLAAEGITGGCATNPLKYCPGSAVTRDQMAVFLLRAKYGSGYVPPAASGVFADVSTDYWAAAWIEALAAEGVTAGCGNNNYCPGTPVTRDQMAVFLVRNFNLP